MFRQQLFAGASRFVRAPSDDYGAEDTADIPEDDGDLPEEDEEPAEEDADADTAELADDDTGEDDDEPPARRQPSRGERRFAALNDRAKAAEERAARAEAAAQDVQNRIAQAAQGQNAQQRQAYLETLDPDQRTDFLLREQQQQFGQAFQGLRFEMQDTSDKASFEALCARQPTAEKLKAEVEAELQKMRRAGTTAPRETILRYIIGDRALTRAPQAKGRAEKKAAVNRERQTARPGQARSDVAPTTGRRTNEQEARRKRLENMKI